MSVVPVTFKAADSDALGGIEPVSIEAVTLVAADAEDLETEEVRAALAELDKLNKADFLKTLSDAQLTCRAYVHQWPIPVPGRKLPKGYGHYPQRDGSYKIVHTCRRCGEYRTKLTLPGGMEDPLGQWTYHYPEGWTHIETERHVSRLDIKNEYNRRLFERATGKNPGR
jgi:hypothetical protein